MLESQDHSIEIDLFDKQILFYLAKGTNGRFATIHSDFVECN
jgi:hypothetical protein